MQAPKSCAKPLKKVHKPCAFAFNMRRLLGRGILMNISIFFPRRGGKVLEYYYTSDWNDSTQATWRGNIKQNGRDKEDEAGRKLTAIWSSET
jgi:hypothetical protein